LANKIQIIAWQSKILLLNEGHFLRWTQTPRPYVLNWTYMDNVKLENGR
jgi:hypothetical protein